jgi:hypothetical protein
MASSGTGFVVGDDMYDFLYDEMGKEKEKEEEKEHEKKRKRDASRKRRKNELDKMQQMEDVNRGLIEERDALQANFGQLLKTARIEINRKNVQIAGLKRKMDDLIFRRICQLGKKNEFSDLIDRLRADEDGNAVVIAELDVPGGSGKMPEVPRVLSKAIKVLDGKKVQTVTIDSVSVSMMYEGDTLDVSKSLRMKAIKRKAEETGKGKSKKPKLEVGCKIKHIVNIVHEENERRREVAAPDQREKVATEASSLPRSDAKAENLSARFVKDASKTKEARKRRDSSSSTSSRRRRSLTRKDRSSVRGQPSKSEDKIAEKQKPDQLHYTSSKDVVKAVDKITDKAHISLVDAKAEGRCPEQLPVPSSKTDKQAAARIPEKMLVLSASVDRRTHDSLRRSPRKGDRRRRDERERERDSSSRREESHRNRQIDEERGSSSSRRSNRDNRRSRSRDSKKEEQRTERKRTSKDREERKKEGRAGDVKRLVVSEEKCSELGTVESGEDRVQIEAKKSEKEVKKTATTDVSEALLKKSEPADDVKRSVLATEKEECNIVIATVADENKKVKAGGVDENLEDGEILEEEDAEDTLDTKTDERKKMSSIRERKVSGRIDSGRGERRASREKEEHDEKRSHRDTEDDGTKRSHRHKAEEKKQFSREKRSSSRTNNEDKKKGGGKQDIIDEPAKQDVRKGSAENLSTIARLPPPPLPVAACHIITLPKKSDPAVLLDKVPKVRRNSATETVPVLTGSAPPLQQPQPNKALKSLGKIPKLSQEPSKITIKTVQGASTSINNESQLEKEVQVTETRKGKKVVKDEKNLSETKSSCSKPRMSSECAEKTSKKCDESKPRKPSESAEKNSKSNGSKLRRSSECVEKSARSSASKARRSSESAEKKLVLRRQSASSSSPSPIREKECSLNASRVSHESALKTPPRLRLSPSPASADLSEEANDGFGSLDAASPASPEVGIIGSTAAANHAPLLGVSDMDTNSLHSLIESKTQDLEELAQLKQRLIKAKEAEARKRKREEDSEDSEQSAPPPLLGPGQPPPPPTLEPPPRRSPRKHIPKLVVPKRLFEAVAAAIKSEPSPIKATIMAENEAPSSSSSPCSREIGDLTSCHPPTPGLLSPSNPLAQATPSLVPPVPESPPPVNFNTAAGISQILRGSLIQGGYVSPVSGIIRTPTPGQANYSPNAHLRSSYVS